VAVSGQDDAVDHAKSISAITGELQQSSQTAQNHIESVSADGFSDVSNLIDMFVDGKPLGNAEPTDASCSSAVMPGCYDNAVQKKVVRATKSTSNRKVSSTSRSVMSLLCENRGSEVADGGCKAYLKDPRPVASLLKEERERHQMQPLLTVTTCFTGSAKTASSAPLYSSTLAVSQETCLLPEELLVAKTPSTLRRPSLERPSSVSDLLCIVPSRPFSECPLPLQTSTSNTSGALTRKRPHTVLDDPLPMSEPWNVGHPLSVDLIEKSALDDLMELGGTDMKEESFVNTNVNFSASFSNDIDSIEPPPAKLSFVNRSAENMTLQQLQQIRLRESLRRYTEHTKRSSVEQSHVPLLAGRPASMLGESLTCSDGLALRDSRPNTVVGYWERTVYREGSSSVDSCASVQLPTFHPTQTFTHFTPIQTLSDDLQSTCDLVRPTAKIAVVDLDTDIAADTEVTGKHCNLSRAGLKLEQPLATWGTQIKKVGRSKRSPNRHKSVDRNITLCSSEHAAPLLAASTSLGSISSPVPRSESPLSTEICNIIGHSNTVDFGAAVDDYSSPHRSYSVPVMIDCCFSEDIDVFIGGSETPDNMHHSSDDRENFWSHPARGDHMISGASFRPVRCGDPLVTPLPPLGPGNTAQIVSHTPPSSQNPSPNFEVVLQPSHSDSTVVVNTPTSLVSGPVNDNLVDELFATVCENQTQLLDWDCT
jgi:hypothetical protein